MKAITHIKVLIPFLIGIGFFLYWAFSSYMTKPFVWDEIVSLTNFVLVDLKTTVTQYPDVNNHIFFNFVNNIYTGILGVSDLYDAMDQVFTIRILPLILSLASLSYVFLIGHRFFNSNIAVMAVMLLATTIPFLNFTMQLRGYTMSTTLLAAFIFHALSFERRANILHGIALLIISTALIYTIPSNVFFAISIALIFVLRWIQNGRRASKMKLPATDAWIMNKYFVLLSIIGVSAILSYFLYLPVLEDLLNERHLQQVKGKAFYAYNLEDLLPNVLFGFLSYRYLFVLPLLVGLYAFISSLRKYGWSDKRIYYTTFIILTLILPFLISLVRGDKTPQRSFVPLSVSFSLLIAISVYSSFRDFKWARKFLPAVIGIVFAYNIGSYFYGKSQVNKVLHKAMLDRKKMNSMMYNFYQSNEYDLHQLDLLIQEARATGYPIIMAEEIDRVSEGEYLHKHNLRYFSTVWCKQMPAENEQGFQYNALFEISQGRGNKPGYDRIGFPPKMSRESGKLVPLVYYLIDKKVLDSRDPKFYALTYAPRWFEKIMRENFPELKYQKLNRRSSYHNMYLVTRK